MSGQTTKQEKPFLENGLINRNYIYDERISNATIEGIDSWHLMMAIADIKIADIGTIQASRIEDEINELDIFDQTIYLDEITVTDLIDKIEKSDVILQSGDYDRLMKVLEQLKDLDNFGFIQKVIEKRLKNGAF
jgi:hypothetical protein